MNKQLRELIKQHGINITVDGLGYGEGNIEGLAELIVRECVDIVENNNPCPPGTIKMYHLDQDEYFDKGWQVAAETKSNQIRKHFGVEE